LEIIEFKKLSIFLCTVGIILTLVGITIFWHPYGNVADIIFLGMIGLGLFMLGLGFSILNQIRKSTVQS